MNFSDLFQQTNGLCLFSPNGKYLANCVQYRLIVRDVRTLQILHLYTCLDAVQHLQWSPDSQFILCGMFKRGMTQVWSIDQPEWTCKIDEGSAGLESVCWSPDSRHILTFANFQLRITVWSLINKSVSYIKYPKQGKKMLDFTRDGSYMALAERRDCKDYISVFSCKQWQLMKVGNMATPLSLFLDNMPCALWIWDIRQLAQVAILLQAAPVKHVEWDPCQPRLAFCTGTNKVYMWSPAGALSVDVPVEASFLVQSLRWHPEGGAVLLMGRENMCMCFIDREKNR
ncbi:PREDICTED: WD repeat-containing protein WRAP73-like [Branchiostoma belcheri]|uniref:WD repeat-containing protein WRAP73-like n=1 Tax=Branchiostoma belcheri TaxID=7741 RepID=A0A6P5ALH4_BRABE|nr:PREDICTED: WD repeat-containing protein WRAP73-like [Branchiostoma belcheri]